jgi:hypothetical protein
VGSRHCRPAKHRFSGRANSSGDAEICRRGPHIESKLCAINFIDSPVTVSSVTRKARFFLLISGTALSPSVAFEGGRFSSSERRQVSFAY